MTMDELTSALAAIDRGQPGAVSPWYVQVMMGFCAWLAALLLVAFAGIAIAGSGRSEDATVLLVLGVCACAAAAGLYRSMGESPFGSQFALALSCAGQLGIAGSLWIMEGSRTALWGMLVVEVVLIGAMRNRLHRVLSTFTAVMVWALATHEILFHQLPGIHIIWGAPGPETYALSVLSIVLWLVDWAPVVGLACWLVKNEARWMAGGGTR